MYYDKSKYTEEEVKSLEIMMAKDLGEGVKNFSVDLNNGWYYPPSSLLGCQLFGPDGRDANTVTFNDAKRSWLQIILLILRLIKFLVKITVIS